MKLLLTLPLLLALYSIADAGCRVVQRQVVVPVVQPVQLLLPAYGGYSAASYQGGQQLNDDIVRKLVEVLERIEGKLDEPAGGHTAQSVMATSCAKCHQEGANPKGGFVLFQADGSPAELSLGDKRLIRRAVTTTDPKQRMPPDRQLSQPAAAALLQGLGK